MHIGLGESRKPSLNFSSLRSQAQFREIFQLNTIYVIVYRVFKRPDELENTFLRKGKTFKITY